jgi:hypothetical protein
MKRRLLACCAKDDELCLDVIDAYLHLNPHDDDDVLDVPVENLRSLCVAGGSAWTVSADGKSLQRAVDSESEAAFERATSPADVATNGVGLDDGAFQHPPQHR